MCDEAKADIAYLDKTLILKTLENRHDKVVNVISKNEVEMKTGK